MFSTSSRRRRGTIPAGLLALVLAPLALAATPAHGNTAGTDLVISEVYGGGGNLGATYTHDFIELYNPTGAAISLDGLSVQYRSSSGSGTGFTNLSGSVAAGRHFLIQQAQGSGGTQALPAPDATGTLALSGTAGSVALVDGTGTVTPAAGNTRDLVGYGAATLCEREDGDPCAPATSNTTSTSRDVERTDTDVNADDFTSGTPDPQNSGAVWPPDEEPPTPGTTATIAEIQGRGDASPLTGELITTRGVVTAAYPTGGFFDFVIQTEGTGGADDATPGASDGLWVTQTTGAITVEPGDFVEVTGTVQENFGRTQLSYDPATPLTTPSGAFDGVTPLTTGWWPTDGEREAHEGELVDLSTQPFTVTNSFSINQFGEVGLATGDRPLISPTEVANPNLDPSGYQVRLADNARRGLILDDGSSANYQTSSSAKRLRLPWIDADTSARVGASAEITGPVVVDFGFGAWRVQPTRQVTGPQPGLFSFEDTRPDNLAPQEVGGDLTIATFNVLNYFTTLGDADDDNVGDGGCNAFTDRDGDGSTVSGGCEQRGAWDPADLGRQQAKIVKAINGLEASVVSLEEIENSAALGEADRDEALGALTDALNADAGGTRWAFVPSPPASELPASEDVIRTAFIYDPSVVELRGTSALLDDPAFSNARQPLAQVFRPRGTTEAGDAFAVVVNHFKSKGSACASDPGAGAEPPQGNCNNDRVNQARALAGFADDFAADRGVAKVFLTGDFNSYSEEDPIITLERAGYTPLESDTPGDYTYSFDGQSGSLDHVLANDAALADVTGVDVWEINANEALAYEYSRWNYNETNFYAPDVFRASDHNPELVGLDARDATDVSLSVAPAQVKRKKETVTATVTLTGDDSQPTGSVRFLLDGVEVGERVVRNGTASIALGPLDRRGTYQITVEYTGDDDNLGGTDSASFSVRP